MFGGASSTPTLIPSPSVVASPSPPPLSEHGGSSTVISQSGIVKTLDPQLVVNPNLSPANSRTMSASPVTIPSVDVHPGSYTSMPLLDSFPGPMLIPPHAHDSLYSPDDTDHDEKRQPPDTHTLPSHHPTTSSSITLPAGGHHYPTGVKVSFTPRTPVTADTHPSAPSTTSSVASSSSPLDLIHPTHSSSSSKSTLDASSSSSSTSNSIHRSNSLLHLRGTNKKLVLGMVGLPARGKCWARGTRLRLHSGDTVSVEEVRGGELLMGDDGLPRVVTSGSLTRGCGAMYRVVPQWKGGTAFEVNGEHILVLAVLCPPRKVGREEEREEQRRGWKVREYGLTMDNRLRLVTRRFHSEEAADAEVARRLRDWQPLEWEVSVEAFLAHPQHLRSVTRMFTPPAVTFVNAALPRLEGVLSTMLGAPATAAQVEWAAWYLGLWLTDAGVSSAHWIVDRPTQKGDSAHHRRTCKRLLQYRSLFGEAVTRAQEDVDGVLVGVWQLGEAGSVRSLARHLLCAYALLDHKHVPQAWVCDTIDVRRRILAGMVGGAGRRILSAERRSAAVEVATRERGLALGCRLLAASLGIKAGAVEKHTGIDRYTRQQGVEHRVTLSADVTELIRPCLPKSSHSWESPLCSRCHAFSVRPLPCGEYFGFTVHGGANRRFLLEDFTVTHNVGHQQHRTAPHTTTSAHSCFHHRLC